MGFYAQRKINNRGGMHFIASFHYTRNEDNLRGFVIIIANYNLPF